MTLYIVVLFVLSHFSNLSLLFLNNKYWSYKESSFNIQPEVSFMKILLITLLVSIKSSLKP